MYISRVNLNYVKLLVSFSFSSRWSDINVYTQLGYKTSLFSQVLANVKTDSKNKDICTNRGNKDYYYYYHMKCY